MQHTINNPRPTALRRHRVQCPTPNTLTEPHGTHRGSCLPLISVPHDEPLVKRTVLFYYLVQYLLYCTITSGRIRNTSNRIVRPQRSSFNGQVDRSIEPGQDLSYRTSHLRGHHGGIHLLILFTNLPLTLRTLPLPTPGNPFPSADVMIAY